QHLRERTAALAATPAIHQWAPLAGPLRECALEHRSDVACNDRGAELARRERRIHIEGAHTRTLGVVEHRMIRRRRHVILGELRWAAHIDAVGVLGEGRDADAAHARVRRAGGAHGWTPTLAASLTHSAAALPPKGAQFAPGGGPATLICAFRMRRAAVSTHATRCRGACFAPLRPDGCRRAGTSHCPRRSPRT